MEEHGGDVAAALETAFERVESTWCCWADTSGDEAGTTALVSSVWCVAGWRQYR